MDLEDLTVLYIAGYGRSGSTVLDVLLGSHDQAVSVGELVYLGEEWQHGERTCACGREYKHCPFWEDVFSSSEEANEWKRLARRIESRGRLLSLVSGAISDRDRDAYRGRARALFSRIAKRGRASVVVDSSKSARHAAGRFWALHNVAGLDVRVLHLVRDGRDVLRSVIEKGSNWAVEGYRDKKRFLGARTITGWVLANSLAWMCGKALGKDRYLRIRFEDLLSDPAPVLEQIGNFVGMDLSSVVRRAASGRTFSVGHNVGGNRIRHKDEIRLRRKSKTDRRPWVGLGHHHQVLFGLLGQWLNIALGYKW